MSALTQESLDGLLRFLDPDRERAGERYEGVRRKLIKFFENRGCAFPEEPTDETINRVARRIAEGVTVHASDPAAYFYGVARHVLMEEWDRPERRQVGLEELPARELPREQAVGPEPEGDGVDCLGRCLEVLSAAQREMVVAYYEWGRRERIGSRKDLAARLGLPMNAMRLRVHRIRESLERCVAACLDRPGSPGDIDPPETTTSGRGKVYR